MYLRLARMRLRAIPVCCTCVQRLRAIPVCSVYVLYLRVARMRLSRMKLLARN